jgi:hypothetical protein
MEQEKTGVLTIKLKLDYNKATIITTPEVSIKKPQPALPMSIHFADADGSLTRSDPNQRDMFAANNLRAISSRDE